MAETATIARPYAEAVFDLADRGESLARWSDVLSTMAGIAADAEMLAAAANPRISADQLYGLFASLCGDELALEAQNLLRVLIENRRIELLPAIREIFEELKNQRESLVEAEITTAIALTDSQLASLVSDLERRYRRKVQPAVRVDPQLIGGARVVVGDEVIDGSVRGKLAALAAGLARS